MIGVQVAINSMMTASLRNKDWHLRSVCGLPPLFLREMQVTPYLSATVRRRARDHFMIDGSVGVIHRDFEGMWMKAHAANREPDISENSVSNSLHMGNILTLNRYITANTYQQDVESFCEAIAEILEAMPQDEVSLQTAFRTDRMAGRPIDSFGGVYKPEKFRAFKEFVFMGAYFTDAGE